MSSYENLNKNYTLLLEKYNELLSNGGEIDSCSRDDSIEYSQPLHIGAVFIILACSALGTLIPILATHVKALRIPKYSIILGKCCGIGVILACALIHMLLPAVESLSSPCLPKSFTDSYGAYAYLFAMLAAIVMQFLDFVFFEYITRKQRSKQHSQETKSILSPDSDTTKKHNHYGGLGVDDSLKEVEIHHHENHNHNNHSHTPGNDQNDCHGGHVHGGLLMDPAALKTIEAYLLEFGITVHSVFIGLAVGVVGDDTLKALLVALSFHQFGEGLALGSRISDANLKSHWHEALLATIFTVSAPIGIAIGVIVASSINVNGSDFLFIQGIFDSVCAGILLYIGFSLMIKDFPEDMNTHCKNKKYEYPMKIGMFISLWVGGGVLAYIGKYL